jgi:hypothetical protein
MAIKADKQATVPAHLIAAARQASEDYDDARNRSTIGTYVDERFARVVYALLEELKKSGHKV